MNIAITGAMGSGKSRIAKALVELLGARGVSADRICRRLLQPGNPGYLKVRHSFPNEFFLDDGCIDRSRLRRAIFGDPVVRGRLDSILHPLVLRGLLAAGVQARDLGCHLVAEVPLLFEKGWQRHFDCSVVVFASNECCVTRISRRDLVTEDEARQAMKSQMDLDEKCRLADWVLDNDGSFSDTLISLQGLVATLDAPQDFGIKKNRGLENP